MKYAVLQYSETKDNPNGSFTTAKEGYADNLDGAKQAFHSHCNALYGDAKLVNAVVKLVDENLDTVDQKYVEVINKEMEKQNDVELPTGDNE